MAEDYPPILDAAQVAELLGMNADGWALRQGRAIARLQAPRWPYLQILPTRSTSSFGLTR